MSPFRLAFEKCRGELSLPAQSSLDRLAARLAMLKPQGRDVLASWTSVIRRSAPGLSTEECQALAVYALGVASASARGDGDLMRATQYMQENRSFTMVSNIMKAKHGTVKNSISNIH
jgi:hypothetical protein